MEEVVLLKIYNTRIEAEIAKSALSTNDIKSYIVADDMVGTNPYPFQPKASGVGLFVNFNDFRQAQKILDKAQNISG